MYGTSLFYVTMICMLTDKYIYIHTKIILLALTVVCFVECFFFVVCCLDDTVITIELI